MLSKDQDKWLFDCNGCYGKFPTKKALEDHLNRRLFDCPFGCDQSFVHKYELVPHGKTCPGRIKNSTFDNYRIYHMIDVRHKVKPSQQRSDDLWVKYPYWHEKKCRHTGDHIIFYL